MPTQRLLLTLLAAAMTAAPAGAAPPPKPPEPTYPRTVSHEVMIPWGAALVEVTVGASVAMRVFGGVSGDVYGAINKLAELLTYVAVASL